MPAEGHTMTRWVLIGWLVFLLLCWLAGRL